ncbi:PREDICTED: uncharacterized protein LOC106147758 [Chinchilla lanigera]|uniref:uncharacterized protein LOC106147758 n=1 Tax=Chinchilla lanigera TaxID=34839 RepID=UPI000696A5A5|nr:PREDICTED: uncharacterized protein LOC106147758 [Chinchilla lanigera]
MHKKSRSQVRQLTACYPQMRIASEHLMHVHEAPPRDKAATETQQKDGEDASGRGTWCQRGAFCVGREQRGTEALSSYWTEGADKYKKSESVQLGAYDAALRGWRGLPAGSRCSSASEWRCGVCRDPKNYGCLGGNKLCVTLQLEAGRINSTFSLGRDHFSSGAEGSQGGAGRVPEVPLSAEAGRADPGAALSLVLTSCRTGTSADDAQGSGPRRKLPASMPFHHNVPALKPADHGLNPLKQ